ncbi:nuclear transport factor 2 family protein [Pyxidicoccus fallax]|uniref:Nuclear transport factor 2 family protein n=1 Tax=Pyxidicoccus fallax TaxID=394095 RepID=A0A848LXV5_9BACT|nr:nuclear transport factor 2 family protein [Pyxidicoccus fallax]NMO22646.1 nuclear transport factor 2 family protein [Pyxidicoccus fallax]NPC84725.1 nuclear transport factor 2 family protein [Pyxidicoccus fallax]
MKQHLGVMFAVGSVVVGSVLAAGAAWGAGGADEAGARKAVELYLQGHATGKVEHFREAFHPEMKMYFNRDGVFSRRTADEYIGALSGKPAQDEARRKRRIVSLDVTGDVGVAKVELDYPEALLTDYLTVVKVDGTWRIVNKVFHRQAR